MKNFFVKLVLIMSAICLLAIPVSAMTLTYDGVTHEYTGSEIRLFVNDVEITGLPTPPVNLFDRVYVPAREVFEAIGAAVDWKGETSQVYIGYENTLIVLQIDSTDVNINGVVSSIPVPPKNINNKTMIPVRFAAEMLDFTIEWDGVNTIVYIYEPNYNSSETAEPSPVDIDDEHIESENTGSNDDSNINEDTNSENPVDTNSSSEDISNENTSSNLDDENAETNDQDGDVQQIIDDSLKQHHMPEDVDTRIEDQLYDIPVDTGIDTSGSLGENIMELIELQDNDFVSAAYDYAVDVTSSRIMQMTYPETKISQLQMPSSTDGYKYRIKADSAISKVEWFMLSDNRLVVDIFNAALNLPQTAYTISGNNYLSSIRAGQFQMAPEKITRIVFDISMPVSYSVMLSTDRKEIVVTLEKNKITGISFSTDGESDLIIIEGNIAPAVTLLPLKTPDRLVIDIPLSVLSTSVKEMTVNGAFSKNIRTGQFEPEKARIVVDLKSTGSYESSVSGNKTIIRISKPTYQNMAFSSDKMVLSIKKEPGFSLDINDIIHKDLYRSYQYILTLPGDYSEYLGSGIKVVKDSFINTINIQTVGGKTQVTFNEKQILTFVVTEDKDNVYFNAMLPKDRYQKIVVLDPGHGGSDPGNLGVDGAGLVEKNMNLDVSNRLISLLESNSSIKVYATRISDVYPSFEDRVNLGNIVGDIYISLHYNAYTTKTPSGIETYYSDYSLPKGHSYSGKAMADIIQKNLINDLGTVDRKVKKADFYVIKNTKVPSVLVELGFLTNPAEATKIATPEFRQKTAESLYRSILEVFEAYKPAR